MVYILLKSCSIRIVIRFTTNIWEWELLLVTHPTTQKYLINICRQRFRLSCC